MAGSGAPGETRNGPESVRASRVDASFWAPTCMHAPLFVQDAEANVPVLVNVRVLGRLAFKDDLGRVVGVAAAKVDLQRVPGRRSAQGEQAMVRPRPAVRPSARVCGAASAEWTTVRGHGGKRLAHLSPSKTVPAAPVTSRRHTDPSAETRRTPSGGFVRCVARGEGVNCGRRHRGCSFRRHWPQAGRRLQYTVREGGARSTEAN